MTILSVNLNKLALLRNSRGHNYPDLLHYAARLIELGAGGITIHPRPDERHIRYDDARRLSALLERYPGIELNIEGYPSESFMALIDETRPHQCTLVPDAPDQLTSDHGWDFRRDGDFVSTAVAQLKVMGLRVAVFLDPDPGQVPLAAASGTDRIELYTEAYARAWETDSRDTVLAQYAQTASAAQQQGLGVNAGHDLNLRNLASFLTIPGILEVSIGHALTVECIDQGMASVIKQYLAICNGS